MTTEMMNMNQDQRDTIARQLGFLPNNYYSAGELMDAENKKGAGGRAGVFGCINPG